MWKSYCLIVVLSISLLACSFSLAGKKDGKKVERFTPWSEVAANNASSDYGEAELMGKITDKALGEISGLTASRTAPNVYWVHNDSGDAARLYAIDLKGTLLAKVDVQGAENKDWEDIASGPGADGKPALYIADTGNNTRSREQLTIYRIPEPQISKSKKSISAKAEAFPFSYPDGRHDCEAIFVDQSSGRIYLITKNLREDCGVYRFPMPLKTNQKVVVEKVEGKKIQSLERLRMVTGAGTSPDGLRVVIRTYFGAFELQRAKGQAFEAIFNQEPTVIKVPLLSQSEAIAYSADGKSIITTSEKLPAPIYLMTRK